MLEVRNRKIRSVVISSAVEKYLCFCLCLFFIFSCNSENAPDCFQTTGDLTRTVVSVPEFTTITVFENLNLVLKQGDVQKVELESGENLINEIAAEVEEGRLVLRNDNGCNFIREYGLSTVYVTAPNLTQVRSSTGGLISSDGVLGYQNLSLFSESFTEPDAETTDGSFDLALDVGTISIVVNGIAYLKLTGRATNFSVAVAAGDSRVEAENLMAENVSVNHRGTNDLFVNPQQRISGVIRSYGDVISYNRPPAVSVEEQFDGKLIFRD